MRLVGGLAAALSALIETLAHCPWLFIQILLL